MVGGCRTTGVVLGATSHLTSLLAWLVLVNPVSARVPPGGEAAEWRNFLLLGSVSGGYRNPDRLLGGLYLLASFTTWPDPP